MPIFTIRLHTLLLMASLILTSCASQQTTTESKVYSQSNFANFKTWRWHLNDQDESVNEMIHDLVKGQIESELQSKGMKLTSEGEVDFLVNYIVNVREDLKVDKLEKYEGFSERYIGIDPHGRYVNVTAFQMRKQLDEAKTVENITKGTLIIDILDPTSNKLLIRALAEKPLPEKKVAPKTRHKRISNIIKKLLQDFPPEEK